MFLEMLLTSKLAAKDGYESFCICAPGQESKSRQLMYGFDDENKNDSATMDTNTDADNDTSSSGDEQQQRNQRRRAIPVSSAVDIQNVLTKANVLILVSYNQPIKEKALNTLLKSAGNDYLSKIVLILKL